MTSAVPWLLAKPTYQLLSAHFSGIGCDWAFTRNVAALVAGEAMTRPEETNFKFKSAQHYQVCSTELGKTIGFGFQAVLTDFDYFAADLPFLTIRVRVKDLGKIGDA